VDVGSPNTTKGAQVARTDDDTWDINESVGATALGVAVGRAAETNNRSIQSDPDDAVPDSVFVSARLP
jgi:hypothetical protein